jgi:hypothetical protein
MLQVSSVELSRAILGLRCVPATTPAARLLQSSRGCFAATSLPLMHSRAETDSRAIQGLLSDCLGTVGNLGVALAALWDRIRRAVQRRRLSPGCSLLALIHVTT